MFNISDATFIGFSTTFQSESSVIEMVSSSPNQPIQIEYCSFQNLNVSSYGHAGAVFLTNYDSCYRFNDFIKCECLNSENDDAGNAIKGSNGKTNIIHCLISKCAEVKAVAESTVSIRNPEEHTLQYSNFTNNIAQDVQGIIHGCPSVECTSSNRNHIMKFCHIENSKGYRAVYLALGDMFNTNIIKYEGSYLLDSIDSIINCCFFEITVKSKELGTNKLDNCLSDNIWFNESTTEITLIALINNARWKKSDPTCRNVRSLQTNFVALFAVELIFLHID